MQTFLENFFIFFCVALSRPGLVVLSLPLFRLLFFCLCSGPHKAPALSLPLARVQTGSVPRARAGSRACNTWLSRACKSYTTSRARAAFTSRACKEKPGFTRASLARVRLRACDFARASNHHKNRRVSRKECNHFQPKVPSPYSSKQTTDSAKNKMRWENPPKRRRIKDNIQYRPKSAEQC